MGDPYYRDDTVALYLGDCLTVTEWLDADVLITDPPYGRAWKQGRLSPSHWADDSRAGIAGDTTTDVRDDALEAWGDRPGVVFGDLMLAPPARTKLVAIYHKAYRGAGIRGAIGAVRRDAEAIYLTGRGWGSGIGGRSAVFASSALIGSPSGIVARGGGHPHTKPVGVMLDLIALTSGTIADPFAGSGSTLVAAKQAGRPAIGVELEERYCEMAARRLAQDVLPLDDPSPATAVTVPWIGEPAEDCPDCSGSGWIESTYEPHTDTWDARECPCTYRYADGIDAR